MSNAGNRSHIINWGDPRIESVSFNFPTRRVRIVEMALRFGIFLVLAFAVIRQSRCQGNFFLYEISFHFPHYSYIFPISLQWLCQIPIRPEVRRWSGYWKSGWSPVPEFPRHWQAAGQIQTRSASLPHFSWSITDGYSVLLIKTKLKWLLGTWIVKFSTVSLSKKFFAYSHAKLSMLNSNFYGQKRKHDDIDCWRGSPIRQCPFSYVSESRGSLVTCPAFPSQRFLVKSIFFN